ncbi:MAG: cytidine deaminase [Acidimicrobiales bacterium]
MTTEVDWDQLRRAATEAAANAYAPYSRLQVGAAALTEAGEVITGVNVENVSFGLTFCAEISLLGRMITDGSGPIVALAATDHEGRCLTPCGRCRQVLMELAGPALLVNGATRLETLLPDAFTPDDLP